MKGKALKRDKHSRVDCTEQILSLKRLKRQKREKVYEMGQSLGFYAQQTGFLPQRTVVWSKLVEL